MLRSLRSLSLVLAAAGLLAPAAANGATTHKSRHATASAKKTTKKKSKKKKVIYPVVTSVLPLHVKVGDKLIIRGKNFRVGKAKNTVVFKRDGQPGIFVKSDLSTQRMMTVVIPDTVGAHLALDPTGAGRATTFRLRVIAARFAPSYTAPKYSPVISPKPKISDPASTATPGSNGNGSAATDAYQKCLAAVPGTPSADADSDGLTNATETAIKTDPCNADTDGDGITDGYEYYSAIDLNSTALPYPAKRPWPNPLDPNDAAYDFDGDGLYMWQEFKLWKYVSGKYPLTAYSDGTQNTGGPQPVTTLAQQYLDLDGDGNLTDDERDADNDGLSNQVEFNYTGTQKWWNTIIWPIQPHGQGTSYTEIPYTERLFNDTDPADPDTDGDGILDGADDQDNDGWPNYVEMQLGRLRTGYRVHPFNPCLPNPWSPTCSRWIPPDPAKRWPPFDIVDQHITSQMPGDALPFHWDPVVLYDSNWGPPNNVPSPDVPGSVFAGPWNPSPGKLFRTDKGWNGYGGPQGP